MGSPHSALSPIGQGEEQGLDPRAACSPPAPFLQPSSLLGSDIPVLFTLLSSDSLPYPILCCFHPPPKGVLTLQGFDPFP